MPVLTSADTTGSVSAAGAAAELLARRRARLGLLEFAGYTNSAYRPAAHHHLIAAALERVARGEVKRLMICMPPRHGKSELASRRFPAWYLGGHPIKHVIAASYNSDLANDFGREVRNIVASPEFQTLFAIDLAADSKAANRWHTDKGGMYVAAGVGTAITGRGADILLIDDPFKDRADADSELKRNSVWDWYTSTAYTRLMPGGAIVVISTRWHDDDLAGRLLAAQEAGGDRWDLISLPAISGGEALWPAWYPLTRLEEIRAVLPARDWNSLYQQNPIPDDGDFFKGTWFGEFDVPPDSLRIYGASDYAVTDGGGDYTVHGVFGIDEAGTLYVLDWWRKQTSADVWIDSFCDLIARYQPLCWFGEAGPIRRAVEPFMRARMIERGAICRMEWLASISDKATRARSFQALASMGKVILPRRAPWLADVLGELLRFPAGKNDDSVDVCSLMGRGLQFVRSTRKPPRELSNASEYVAAGWMG